MLPPENAAVSQLSIEIGIPENTLNKWRKEALDQTGGQAASSKVASKLSAADKFMIVLETSQLNETELAEYCRRKGLYREEIAAWRESCLIAISNNPNHKTQLSQELREERKWNQTLERELKRKGKALAEAAALLMLRKKAQAIWGDTEDE